MAESTSIVIFGASGDLTQRKLIPALFSQYCRERLPSEFSVVGFSRRDMTHEAFRKHLCEGLEKFKGESFDSRKWEEFASHLWYSQGDANNAGDFQRLNALLEELEGSPSDRLYYMSTAPRFFSIITEQLGQAGMAQEEGVSRRLIVEKPFGHDLTSARELNSALHEVFNE